MGSKRDIRSRPAGSASGPAQLPHRREELRKYGHRPGRHEAFTKLREAHAELVVAAKLLGAGVQLEIRNDTPDFDCRINGKHFRVEVTTRARETYAVDSALAIDVSRLGSAVLPSVTGTWTKAVPGQIVRWVPRPVCLARHRRVGASPGTGPAVRRVLPHGRRADRARGAVGAGRAG